jgi:hypothetical protein
MRPTTCLYDEPPVLVSDLIDSTTASWNKTKIQKLFVSTDVEIILSLHLCTRVVDDFRAWTHEKKGAFSVRSAYRMLVETKLRNEAWLEVRPSFSDSTGERKSWTTLWKVKVPSKIKKNLVATCKAKFTFS